MQASDLNGAWTYRSFDNNPAEVGGDAAKARALILAEATLTFSVDASGKVTGTIDWGSGGTGFDWISGGLDLTVTIGAPLGDGSSTFEIVGTGRRGTQTDGWLYDYNCRFAHQWPSGVNQVPALVGSVIRARGHNGSPPGGVASFIAVKRV
jgi:hypothetical protein